MDIPAIPAGSTDPLDELIELARPVAARSVDPLQVAAWLEANGMTDRAAMVEFGYLDVFHLAEQICYRVKPVVPPPPPGPTAHWTTPWRDIGHGALYLLPAGVFPVALAVLGSSMLVPWVVLAAGFCWVCSGTVAWAAYRLLGTGRPGSAARLLRWSSIGALPVIAAAAAVVCLVTGSGYGLIALTVLQMAFQMAVTTLMFYRRESLVLAAMTPGLVAGVGYLALGPALLTTAIWLGAGSVALTLGLAVRLTFDPAEHARLPLRRALRGQLRQAMAVTAFIALSAAFFLYPQARYLTDRFDIAMTTLPVIGGMGVVEWRAHRFGDQARALLARVGQPRRFTVGVWLLVLRGLGGCLAAVSVLALILLAGLAWAGRLSAAAATMAAAGVLLAGAYFLGFLLANMGRYAWLCSCLLICLAVFIATGHLPVGQMLSGTPAVLAAAALLLLLYLTALARSIGHVRQYR